MARLRQRNPCPNRAAIPRAEGMASTSGIATHVASVQQREASLAGPGFRRFARYALCVSFGLLWLKSGPCPSSMPGGTAPLGATGFVSPPGLAGESWARQRSANIVPVQLRAEAAQFGDGNFGEYEEPVYSSKMATLWAAVERDLPELLEARNCQLGLVGKGQFVFDAGTNDVNYPIYKRKSEVLIASMTQQEYYMKAFRKCAKAGKDKESVKEFIKYYEGNKRQNQAIDDLVELKKTNKFIGVFLRDVMPEITSDPWTDSLTSLGAIAVILSLTFALFCCLFPVFDPAMFEKGELD